MTEQGELLCEVDFPESPIPSRCHRQINEITIKRDGCVWRVYRNDADQFPSNPHAHNVESGLKLDLLSGRLFFNRQYTSKSISQKDLLFIRSELQRRNIQLPQLIYSS